MFPKFSQSFLHFFTEPLQNITVECGIHCVILWEEFFVFCPFGIREMRSILALLYICRAFLGLDELGEDYCFLIVINMNPALILRVMTLDKKFVSSDETPCGL